MTGGALEGERDECKGKKSGGYLEIVFYETLGKKRSQERRSEGVSTYNIHRVGAMGETREN